MKRIPDDVHKLRGSYRADRHAPKQAPATRPARTGNAAVDRYIAHCGDVDCCRAAIKFACDQYEIGIGRFGDEVELLRGLLEEFPDLPPHAWVRRRLEQLEAEE